MFREIKTKKINTSKTPSIFNAIIIIVVIAIDSQDFKWSFIWLWVISGTAATPLVKWHNCKTVKLAATVTTKATTIENIFIQFAFKLYTCYRAYSHTRTHTRRHTHKGTEINNTQRLIQYSELVSSLCAINCIIVLCAYRNIDDRADINNISSDRHTHTRAIIIFCFVSKQIRSSMVKFNLGG